MAETGGSWIEDKKYEGGNFFPQSVRSMERVKEKV